MAAKHSAHAALVETLRKEPLSDNLAAFRESRELTTHVSDAITEGLSEPWSCAEYAKAASGFVGALAAALGDAPLKHAWLVAMSSAAGLPVALFQLRPGAGAAARNALYFDEAYSVEQATGVVGAAFDLFFRRAWRPCFALKLNRQGAEFIARACRCEDRRIEYDAAVCYGVGSDLGELSLSPLPFNLLVTAVYPKREQGAPWLRGFNDCATAVISRDPGSFALATVTFFGREAGRDLALGWTWHGARRWEQTLV